MSLDSVVVSLTLLSPRPVPIQEARVKNQLTLIAVELHQTAKYQPR